ncbi:hypothetical protein B0J11DRAFT_119007 [Dendryphion nanum]|uniref:Uncharacterized protein n=1 Tax=Dendryphion nanum TaxID=256645 RepID=A0A9P9IDU6_9PLEO|nr:hypothetical protein B0J11DRAFT_119007 [Dendryphion nanum]
MNIQLDGLENAREGGCLELQVGSVHEVCCLGGGCLRHSCQSPLRHVILSSTVKVLVFLNYSLPIPRRIRSCWNLTYTTHCGCRGLPSPHTMTCQYLPLSLTNIYKSSAQSHRSIHLRPSSVNLHMMILMDSWIPTKLSAIPGAHLASLTVSNPLKTLDHASISPAIFTQHSSSFVMQQKCGLCGRMQSASISIDHEPDMVERVSAQ